MDSKILSDVANGVFRLRQDDPHMNASTVVDVHDDGYTTLTTIEVRSGTVVLHCLSSLEIEKDEDEDEHDADEQKADASDDDEEEGDDKEDGGEDEDEDGDEEKTVGKTYTLSSGNSVTVHAMSVRLVPLGTETAEGIYQVQMMKAAD